MPAAVTYDYETFATPNDRSAPTVPVAITGGQSPTEAEHNALRQTVEDLVELLQTLSVID